MDSETSGAHGLAHSQSDSTVGSGVRGLFSLSPRLIDEGAKAPVDPPQTPRTCGVERVGGVRTLRTECGTESGLEGSPCHIAATSPEPKLAHDERLLAPHASMPAGRWFPCQVCNVPGRRVARRGSPCVVCVAETREWLA